jgi:hypothetical protein
VNAAVLRRPSDMPLTPSTGFGGSSSGTDGPDPNDPKYWPPIALVLASGVSGASGPPGQVAGQQYPGQVPGQQGPGQVPGQQYPGQSANGGLPGGYQPGLPGQIPGQNLNSNPSGYGNNGAPMPGQTPALPGQGASGPGYVQPSQFQPQTGTGSNPVAGSAVGMIQTMLTTPHQQSTDSNFGSGTGGAVGFAGVASTVKGPSIKVYKDHQKYQEWEFIFSLQQGQPGQPAGGQNGQGLQPGGQQQTGQGSSSTFAPSTTFGPSSTSQTPQPQQPQQQPPQQQQN